MGLGLGLGLGLGFAPGAVIDPDALGHELRPQRVSLDEIAAELGELARLVRVRVRG